MTASPHITHLRFSPAPPADQRKGLRGWISCRYGDLAIDGITLRRTRAGRLCLSFPVRHDSGGRQHPVVRPVDDEARVALEAAVFEQLGLDAETGR